MTSLRAREATQPLAGEMLKGRVALVAGGTRRVGTAIGRSLGSRLGRRGGVAVRPDPMAQIGSREM